MMQRKFQLTGLWFEKNVYSCGHETFYSIMENLNQVELTQAELYLAANPNCIEFIDGEVILGYNSLEKTIGCINANTTAEIQRIVCSDKSQDLSNIIQQIRRNNIIVLYLDEKALVYQEYEEAKYPYHNVVVDGYDLDEEKLHIIDLFNCDDFGIKKQELYVDMNIIMDNLYEYLVFEKNDKLLIKLRMKETVGNIYKELSGEDKDTVFFKIDEYFHKLEDCNASYKIRSISSFKWIVIYPLLMNCRNYRLEQGDLGAAEEIEQVSKHWDIMHLKYVKDCYRDKKQDYFTNMKIQELIHKTKYVLKL